ncbi:MAG: hypothetical protein LBL79_00385 [Prevotella sp.]|jgi:hypothetical protein|nr:hypothetical protein [Prevotella sp.]
MKKIFILLFLAGMLLSCSNPRVPAVVVGEKSADIKSMDILLEDTTKVRDAHIPSLVDSAGQILVHEIYVESKNEMRKRSYLKVSSSGDNDGRNMVNLMFEDLINQKKHLLTNIQIRISFYQQLEDETGKKYFLYHVIDRDSNKDGKLNSNDIGSLYISNIDGKPFIDGVCFFETNEC